MSTIVLQIILAFRILQNPYFINKTRVAQKVLPETTV